MKRRNHQAPHTLTVGDACQGSPESAGVAPFQIVFPTEAEFDEENVAFSWEAKGTIKGLLLGVWSRLPREAQQRIAEQLSDMTC